jgi:hypothetical protein
LLGELDETHPPSFRGGEDPIEDRALECDGETVQERVSDIEFDRLELSLELGRIVGVSELGLLFDG